MASGNLYEINRQVGVILAKVEAIEDRLDRADDSRAGIHRQLNEIAVRTGHVERDVAALADKVDGIELVTDDVKRVRERARGAGTLGVWLWRFAGALVSFGAGIGAAYTWITGRPPP